jgi:hypothetical protein
MAGKNDPLLEFKKTAKLIEKTIKDGIDKKLLEPIAEEAIKIIVRRTRLGYGVSKHFGTKAKLKALSSKYVDIRSRFKNLDRSTTRPKKSNLTLTGQMLNSMAITKSKDGQIIIGPTGNRNDTDATNEDIARWNSERGRKFNRISQLEFNQLLRFYRKTFGDLLKKRDLIR